jgi:hypothetical protein
MRHPVGRYRQSICTREDLGDAILSAQPAILALISIKRTEPQEAAIAL